MTETTKSKRMGRPPAGPGGVKVEDLPRFTLRLEPETKSLLQAAAEVLDRPAWRIGQDAIAAYLAALPTKKRRQAEALARRKAAQ